MQKDLDFQQVLEVSPPTNQIFHVTVNVVFSKICFKNSKIQLKLVISQFFKTKKETPKKALGEVQFFGNVFLGQTTPHEALAF